ncbi:MAG TPA: DUF2460 domain-containing protein [Patescibacteria group bacterium]|nr:DUF2460 domain-containing protein [Patescibacteria group bacterium]
MSTAIFPTLPGLSWSVGKWPEFSTLVKQAANGAETRIAMWANPRWHFKLKYELLRDDATNELKTLAGFFMARRGQYDSFLFTDPDDNSVTGQMIGVADGATTTYQLLRAFGSFVEPITAPNLSLPQNFYLDGVSLAPGISWVIDPATGLVTFSSAPPQGMLTADFSYYFRVRFDMDQAEFEQFMHQLWSLDTCDLVSVK